MPTYRMLPDASAAAGLQVLGHEQGSRQLVLLPRRMHGIMGLLMLSMLTPKRCMMVVSHKLANVSRCCCHQAKPRTTTLARQD